MKVASLFSGAGGLDLGLQQAGHEIVLQCESDPGAQQVLRHHFPGTLLLPDVRAIQALPKDTELLAAGIPCIDVSCTGHRRGAMGPSTGCGRHVFRLLRRAVSDRRPIPWLLLENVEGFLNRHDQLEESGAAVIETIVKAVEGIGFRSWAYRVVNTAGFGVPHQRRRMLFVASMHGDARDLLLATGMRPCTGACEAKFGQGAMCYRCLRAEELPVGDTSYALDMGNARNSGVADMIPTMTTSNQRILLLLKNGAAGLLRTVDAERLQGLPESWTEPCYPIEGPSIEQDRPHSANNGATDDVSKRARYALIGNAVSVPVAKWIGEQLMKPYLHKYVGHPGDRPLDAEARAASDYFDMTEDENEDSDPTDNDWKGHLLRSPPKSKGGKGSSSKPEQEAGCEAWPRSAWFLKGRGRWAAGHLSDAPELTPLVPLGDFVTQPGKPPSEEALRIYVMRMREGGFDVANLLIKMRQCKLSAGPLAARMVLDESHAAANISSSPAKAKHAAKRALQIGQQGTRCGACLNCKQLRQGGTRRCLLLRATAAAAAGHAGAVVSCMKEKAVGKRVSVWWADDEQWYEGCITHWDGLRWSHTIEYDDGDSEVVALWAPHEMVQLKGACKGSMAQRRESKRPRRATEKGKEAAQADADEMAAPKQEELDMAAPKPANE